MLMIRTLNWALKHKEVAQVWPLQPFHFNHKVLQGQQRLTMSTKDWVPCITPAWMVETMAMSNLLSMTTFLPMIVPFSWPPTLPIRAQAVPAALQVPFRTRTLSLQTMIHSCKESHTPYKQTARWLHCCMGTSLITYHVFILIFLYLFIKFFTTGNKITFLMLRGGWEEREMPAVALQGAKLNGYS